MSRPAVPGFLRHLLLLWGLRFNIGLNRGPGSGVMVGTSHDAPHS